MRMIILWIVLFLCFSCSSMDQRTDNLSEFKVDSFFEEDALDQTQKTRGTQKLTSGLKYGSEVGYSAWYGKELHGRPTASGEIFDMNAYTAAHRTFPMGSRVRVTNLENNKNRVVSINDRGPYVDGRVIDVSYKTALDLGFVEKGVTKVKIALLKEGNFSFLSKLDSSGSGLKSGSPANDGSNIDDRYRFSDGRKPDGYTIQVGAFENRKNAENYRDEVEERFNHRSFIASRGKWHFVWMGDFESSQEAKRLIKKLNQKGIETMYRGKVF